MRDRNVDSSRERSSRNGVTSAVPQPVNNISTSKEDFAEFVEALAVRYPLCRFQRATGEAFSAAGGVAQSDGVGRGIEADLVSAGMRAGTIGCHVYWTRVT